MSKNVNCPNCKQPARLVERPTRVRRGDRVLALSLATWECGHGCVEGSEPFRFIDRALGRQNDEAVRQAWRKRFGEEMPPPRPPGRKPDERRTVPVHVLLTPSEAAELDRRRGEVTRSDFIRERVLSK